MPEPIIIEDVKIYQRQGDTTELNTIIREKFLVYNTATKRLQYSADGIGWESFYGKTELDSKLSLYALTSGLSSTYLSIYQASTTYQTINGQLTAFAGLGYPGTDGYVLSSTTSGVLSWVPMSGGGPYLPLAGGTLTGPLNASQGVTAGSHLVLRDLVGYDGFGAMYPGAVTPDSSNYLFTATNTGTQVYFNATQICAMDINGVDMVLATSSGVELAGSIKLTALDTGILKATSGVVGLATAGTDYVEPSALSAFLTIATAATTYQPLDSDLTAIAALSTNGFAKRTGVGTWVIDSNSYIPLSSIVGSNGQVARFTGTNSLGSDSGLRTSQASGNTYRVMIGENSTSVTMPELLIAAPNVVSAYSDITWSNSTFNPGTPTRRITARWEDAQDALAFFTSEDNGNSRSNRFRIYRSSSIPVAAYGGMTINQGAQEILQVQRGSNGVGTLSGIDWQMLNASSAYVNYARVQAKIISNAAGAQTGSMHLWVYNAGVAQQVAEFTPTTSKINSLGVTTGTVISTAGNLSVLSGTNLVLGNGSTIPQATFATPATLAAYLPLAGGVITGPITGTTSTATPFIHITSTFGNLTNAAIRATASASGGCGLNGIATGTSGAGVWGTSSASGGDGGLFSGTGGSNAIRAIASGGGKAGRFEGDVQITGSLQISTSLTGILKATSGLVSVAVAGADYLAPSALGSYLPLTGGVMTGMITSNVAGANTLAAAFVASSSNPALVLNNTGSGTNNKMWSTSANSSSYDISTWYDNGNPGITALSIARSGITPTTLTVAPNAYLVMSQTPLTYGNSGGLWGQVGDNDWWGIRGGSTGANAGYLEIATGDDASTTAEPIYVRQYFGAANYANWGSIQRTLTLLDANGNTHVPGSAYFGSFINVTGVMGAGSVYSYGALSGASLNVSGSISHDGLIRCEHETVLSSNFALNNSQPHNNINVRGNCTMTLPAPNTLSPGITWQVYTHLGSTITISHSSTVYRNGSSLASGATLGGGYLYTITIGNGTEWYIS